MPTKDKHQLRSNSGSCDLGLYLKTHLGLNCEDRGSCKNSGLEGLFSDMFIDALNPINVGLIRFQLKKSCKLQNMESFF
jgi:hypothetical protein